VLRRHDRIRCKGNRCACLNQPVRRPCSPALRSRRGSDGGAAAARHSQVREHARSRRRAAREHPHGRVPVCAGARRAAPGAGGVRAAQPRPGPAAGVARQGRAGLERSGCTRASALHPGKSAPQGADRRLAPRVARAPARGGRAARGPVRGLQRHSARCRQDRVLPARAELDQPHDPGRFAPGDGEPGGTRGAAWQGAMYLLRPAVRDQVQQQLPVEHHQPRRQGRQYGAHHARAGAGQGVSGYVARRDTQLLNVSARPADGRARPANGFRINLCSDWR
jgi:hypothetical protein